MANTPVFDEAKAKHLQTLKQYVPIVARVHGKNHPEFSEVHRLFGALVRKVEEPVSEAPKLDEIFAELRQVTDNYTVPSDVCESYEAVYSMLAKLDRAYQG